MNKKYKECLTGVMNLTCADYMCNLIKLNIYENENIFNTKKIKVQFRNEKTDELIHEIKLGSNKTIDEMLK